MHTNNTGNLLYIYFSINQFKYGSYKQQDSKINMNDMLGGKRCLEKAKIEIEKST